jgi:hypothetical protein
VIAFALEFAGLECAFHGCVQKSLTKEADFNQNTALKQELPGKSSRLSNVSGQVIHSGLD